MRRGKKSAVTLIEKIAQQPFAQSNGLREVSLLTAGLVDVDERLGEIGIILQIRVEMGFACTPGAIQSSVGTGERTEQKIRGTTCGFQIRGVSQDASRLGHRADHHPVPGRDDFVVQPRRHAFQPCVIHEWFDPIDRPVKLFRGTGKFLGRLFERVGGIGNTMVFPIAVSGNIVIRAKSDRVLLRRNDFPDLFGVPHEKLSFDAFRVGIRGGIIAAFG